MTPQLKALPWLAVLLLGSVTGATAADDPCASFKWNVTQERALFTKAPERVAAGHDAPSAPTVKVATLYELSLSPQDGVKFALPPGKRGLPDGAFAGLVHFKVPATGAYRVSLDQAFWIDVVGDNKLVASTDFGGSQGCNAPHKIVQYTLPAGEDLVLQLSGSTQERVRVTVTPVPAAPAH